MIKEVVKKYHEDLHELYETRDGLIRKKIRLENDIVPYHFEERQCILKRMKKI